MSFVVFVSGGEHRVVQVLYYKKNHEACRYLEVTGLFVLLRNNENDFTYMQYNQTQGSMVHGTKGVGYVHPPLKIAAFTLMHIFKYKEVLEAGLEASTRSAKDHLHSITSAMQKRQPCSKF